MNQSQIIRTILAAAVLMLGTQRAFSADPLTSWNDGPAKTAILDFVAKVTKEGSPDFVPPARSSA